MNGGGGTTATRRMLAAAALLSVFPVAWLAAPWIQSEPVPLCIFRQVAGQPCPLCGLTRAFAAATHGRLREAWAFNPLWPLAAGLIVAFAIALLVDARRPTRCTARLEAWLYRNWRPIVAGLAIFGLARILV